jgi:hypothetical protein
MALIGVSVFRFQLPCFFFLTPDTLRFGAWSLGFHILHSLGDLRWISKALLGRLTEINGDPMDTLAE